MKTYKGAPAFLAIAVLLGACSHDPIVKERVGDKSGLIWSFGNSGARKGEPVLKTAIAINPKTGKVVYGAQTAGSTLGVKVVEGFTQNTGAAATAGLLGVWQADVYSRGIARAAANVRPSTYNQTIGVEGSTAISESISDGAEIGDVSLEQSQKANADGGDVDEITVGNSTSNSFSKSFSEAEVEPITLVNKSNSQAFVKDVSATGSGSATMNSAPLKKGDSWRH